MLTGFSSLAALEVVKKTTFSAAGGGGQCWKFPQVRQSEADNFGGGPGTFC